MAVKTIVQKKRAGRGFMMNKKNVYKLFLFFYAAGIFYIRIPSFCVVVIQSLKTETEFLRVSGPPARLNFQNYPRPGTMPACPGIS